LSANDGPGRSGGRIPDATPPGALDRRPVLRDVHRHGGRNGCRGARLGRRRGPDTALVGAVGGRPARGVRAVLVHLAGFGAYVRWTPRRPTGDATPLPSPDGITTGVRFRYAGRPCYWFTGFRTSMLLSMLGLAALFASSGAVAGIGFAVVIGAAAALLGWLLVTALRLAPGEVTVSPVGVFHRGLTFVRFVPWYAVDGVDARRLGSPAVWSGRTRPRTPGCATSPAGSTPGS
jgi:hypothetical protein